MTTSSQHSTDTLISLDRVTLRLRERHILQDTSWIINRGENWALVGPNGSGKTTLLRALTGHTPVVKGRLLVDTESHAPVKVRYVGPEVHRRYLQDDARTEILWSPVSSNYPQTTPRTILDRYDAKPDLDSYFLKGLGVWDLVDRPVRTLSTGEMRKVLLAAATAASPDLLLLDEPFDGLDEASCSWFASVLEELGGMGITFVLAAHRRDELAGSLGNVIGLEDGRVSFSGRFDDFEDVLPLESPGEAPSIPTYYAAGDGYETPVDATLDQNVNNLVEMRNVSVSYSGNPVFADLSWTVREHEHWCITGPNGSGKTTLLNLICGDNLQVYANDVRIFGKRRGTGESIWDIKRDIGYITPHLSARYDKPMPVRSVIVSGFFDSIGLYITPSESQLRHAEKTAADLGIEELLTKRFDRVSAGERMTVLIARALVKKPKLLILDEPCQGLDYYHRKIILDAVDRAGSNGAASVIYVTHRPDEMPACINRHLKLDSAITSDLP